MADKTKGFSFNQSDKGVLLEKKNSLTKNSKRRQKKDAGEKLYKQIALNLTINEWDFFSKKFKSSGFPSKSSYLKHLLKKAEII